jgi:hypothetical protein
VIVLTVVLAALALGYLLNRVTAMPAARGVPVSQILDEARLIACGGTPSAAAHR